MREFDISFEIKTKTGTLQELTKIIGIEPSGDSHEKGEPKFKKTWTETYWKLFSGAPENAAIEEHLADLFSQMAVSDVLYPEKRFKLLPDDCSSYLSIAIFFNMDGAFETVNIPPEFLKKIADYQLSLELCLYPSRSETWDS